MSDAKAPIKSKGKAAPKITTVSLRSWNKYVALFLALQGVAILISGASRLFPVTSSYLGVDSLQTQVQGHAVLAAGTQHLFDINLTVLVAVFLFIPAIAHGLVATKLRGYYERGLRARANTIRWIEFSLSASVMVVALGLLAGMQDIASLLMLMGLTILMSLLWLATERINNHIPWLSYSLGCAAGALVWLAVAVYLLNGFLFGSTAPAFTVWAAISAFILTIGYAVNLYLSQRKIGKWTNYLYGERVFMLLSLVAKTALAWQLFAGSLRP